MNKVILHGNLKEDPVLKYTSANTALCEFTLAIKEKTKDSKGNYIDKTLWLNCVAWKGVAENIVNHVVAGQDIVVEGKIAISEYNAPDGTKRRRFQIVANYIEFCGHKEGGKAKESSQEIPW